MCRCSHQALVDLHLPCVNELACEFSTSVGFQWRSVHNCMFIRAGGINMCGKWNIWAAKTFNNTWLLVAGVTTFTSVMWVELHLAQQRRLWIYCSYGSDPPHFTSSFPLPRHKLPYGCCSTLCCWIQYTGSLCVLWEVSCSSLHTDGVSDLQGWIVHGIKGTYTVCVQCCLLKRNTDTHA